MKYQMEIPVLIFKIPIISRKEKLRIKGWTGYEGTGFDSGVKDVVYITDTGLVYHATPTCKYLDLSIRRVDYDEAKKQYGICSLCKKEGRSEKKVYITTYGSGYHTSLNCSGLKRTVYAVKKSEIYGRGGCSKCVR